MLYEPKQYWEQRLEEHFDLRGVGHVTCSERYNRWLYRRKRQCIAQVFRHQSLKGHNVLDIGCGTGFFSQWYLEQGARVTGLDITEISVQRLSERYLDATFIVQDITSLPWRVSGLFDIANMWDVAYHIVDDGALERAFDNIVGSLKLGGCLLFTDIFGAYDRISSPHCKNRSIQTYTSILTRKGLILEEVRPLYSMLSRRHIPYIDNLLGGLYFLVDQLQWRPSRINLSLSIWRRTVQKLFPLSKARSDADPGSSCASIGP